MNQILLLSDLSSLSVIASPSGVKGQREAWAAITRALATHGIVSVFELVSRKREEIAGLSGINEDAMAQIDRVLASLRIHFETVFDKEERGKLLKAGQNLILRVGKAYGIERQIFSLFASAEARGAEYTPFARALLEARDWPQAIRAYKCTSRQEHPTIFWEKIARELWEKQEYEGAMLFLSEGYGGLIPIEEVMGFGEDVLKTSLWRVWLDHQIASRHLEEVLRSVQRLRDSCVPALVERACEIYAGFISTLHPEFAGVIAEVSADTSVTHALRMHSGRRLVEFPLTQATLGCCTGSRVFFIRQLVELTEEDLIRKRFGVRTINELKALLERLGLALGMTLPKGFPRHT